MEWMLDIQLGRRNLTPIQRIAVAEKYRPIYEKQAKENQSIGGGDKKSGLVNLPKAIVLKPVNTSEKLASIAGVSERTYRMVEMQGGGSAKKMGLRIKELERLYGIREGSEGKRSLEPNNSALKQSDIASQMGISVDTLENYKMIAYMITELEELLDTGIVIQ